MRSLIISTFTLLVWLCPVKAQVNENLPGTVIESDGEYFLPCSDGIRETSLTVAPGIAKVRPSQVYQLKKKLSFCSSLLENDTVFNPLKGLKVTFRSSILPVDGITEQIKWIPSLVETAIYTTLSNENLPAWNPEPDAWVTIHFNNPKKLVGNPVINDIYMEPRKSGKLFTWLEMDRISVPNRIITVKNNDLPHFEPVSREDFILTLINYFQTSIEKAEKKVVLKNTISVIPQNQAKREIEKQKFTNDLEKIRRIDPELAKELMQAYHEAGFPSEENDNINHEGSTIDQNIVLNSWREAVRKLKAEMNAMSPMERRSQAWWSNKEESNVSGLTPAGYSGSRPLVRLNTNLIDLTLPVSSIQLIVTEWSMLPGSEFEDTTGYNLAFRKLSQLSLREKLWEEIHRLLDP